MTKCEELLSNYSQLTDKAKSHMTRAIAFQKLYDNKDLDVDRSYLKGLILFEVTSGRQDLNRASYYLHQAAECFEE